MPFVVGKKSVEKETVIFFIMSVFQRFSDEKESQIYNIDRSQYL
jgi:hypothetical protein